MKNNKMISSSPSSTNKIIAIEGVIGVGKTTLARMLADRWEAETCFEFFEDNPFLTGGFYENTTEMAFNTEVFFLLSRFKQQREMKASGLIMSDYFFEKGGLFAELNLSPQDLEIYLSVYEKLLPQTRSPDLVVFLQADLETLMRRVYYRDRKFERALSPAYLEKLINEYYRFMSSYQKAPVISISTSGLDFVNDTKDFEKIAQMLEERLSGNVQLSLGKSLLHKRHPQEIHV